MRSIFLESFALAVDFWVGVMAQEWGLVLESESLADLGWKGP